MSRALVISFSNLATDPRVDRQIGALRARHGVTAAGLAPPRYDEVEFVDISTPARSAAGRALGLARLLVRRYEDVYWKHPTNIAILGRLKRIEADVIVANELSALPLALRLGAPVVFDAHEYSPEEFDNRIPWRLVIGPYADWQCRHYIPKVAAMTTVGQTIADKYEEETGVRASVVFNAPPRHELRPTPVHSPVRILHHGAAQHDRGLAEMIRVADLLDGRFTLDFVLVEGTPGYRRELIELARHNPRIGFPDPVPMPEIVRMANAYDIGLYSLPPLNLNQRYALPNKFFEFIQARLGVVIGPSPEMAGIVRRYGLGVVGEDFRPETIAALINGLDETSIAAFKRASDAAANELCADRSAETVLHTVEAALTGAVARRAGVKIGGS